MKTIFYVLVFGFIWFWVGYFTGSRPLYALKVAQQQTEQMASLDQTAVLSADLHIADELHQGKVEQALHSVVLRIDANIASLANKQSSISDVTNSNRIFDYALSYRKTNFWMNYYGFSTLNTNGGFSVRSNSAITVELQKLLAKP
jgi:hypothetical protein